MHTYFVQRLSFDLLWHDLICLPNVSNGIRTHDNTIKSRVLYQLSYKSKIVKHIGSLLLASIGHNRLLTKNTHTYFVQRLSFDLLWHDLICLPNGHRGNRTHSSISQRFYRPPLLLKGLYVHIGIPNNLTDSCYELPCHQAKHRIIVGFSVLFHHHGFWCFPHVSNKLS